MFPPPPTWSLFSCKSNSFSYERLWWELVLKQRRKRTRIYMAYSVYVKFSLMSFCLKLLMIRLGSTWKAYTFKSFSTYYGPFTAVHVPIYLISGSSPTPVVGRVVGRGEGGKLIKRTMISNVFWYRTYKTHLRKKGTGPLSSTTRWKIFSNTSKGIRSDQPFSLSSSRRSSSASLAFILALIRALIRALDLASNKSSLNFSFSDASSLESLLFLLNEVWLSYFRFRPVKVHKLN